MSFSNLWIYDPLEESSDEEADVDDLSDIQIHGWTHTLNELLLSPQDDCLEMVDLTTSSHIPEKTAKVNI